MSSKLHCANCCSCYKCSALIYKCVKTLCGPCRQTTDKNMVSTHTLKHIKCTCGEIFCPDQPKYKCKYCYDQCFHLVDKQVTNTCQLCPNITYSVCHKCSCRNLKDGAYAKRCNCGMFVCKSHRRLTCEYCGHDAHKLTTKMFTFQCNDCLDQSYNVCCNCVNIIDPASAGYSNCIWTCEWNDCQIKTCFKHRQNKVKPKRCSQHQLSKSQKHRYGRPPIDSTKSD